MIGDEAREQIPRPREAARPRVACVGGGSNAIGSFVPFVEDAAVELIGVELRGRV